MIGFIPFYKNAEIKFTPTNPVPPETRTFFPEISLKLIVLTYETIFCTIDMI